MTVYMYNVYTSSIAVHIKKPLNFMYSVYGNVPGLKFSVAKYMD